MRYSTNLLHTRSQISVAHKCEPDVVGELHNFVVETEILIVLWCY